MRTRWRWDRQTQTLVEVTDPSSQQHFHSVQSDYAGYVSPASGRYVEGKAARREDLKATGCIDARDYDWGNRGLSDGSLIESPGHPGHDPDRAQDYIRDRIFQAYGPSGKRSLVDNPMKHMFDSNNRLKPEYRVEDGVIRRRK